MAEYNNYLSPTAKYTQPTKKTKLSEEETQAILDSGGSVISRAPEPSIFQKAIDKLPRHLSEGLFGYDDPFRGYKRGGITEFFFGGIKDEFSPQRKYAHRVDTLLRKNEEAVAEAAERGETVEPMTREQASDIAYRVVTGRSLDDLDEETKKILRNSNIKDKAFAALDTPIGAPAKGVAIGAGYIARKELLSGASGVLNTMFGIFRKGKNTAKVADEVAEETFEVGNALAEARRTGAVVTDTAESGKKTLDEMADMFTEQNSIKNKLKDGGERVSKTYDRLRTEWTDRFTPIKNLVDKVAVTTGKNLDIKVDPYVGARLYQGVNGKIQNTLDVFGGHIKKAGTFGSQGQKNLSMYLTAARMAERGARGIPNPRGITQEGAEAAAKLLETPAIKEAAAGIKRDITDPLLEQSYKSGLISKEGYEAIKANNQSYVPFDVLEKMGDDIDNVNKAAGGFSVAEQNVIKTMRGTDKDIADPLEALTRKIINTTRLIERNEVAKKVADLSKMDGIEDVKKFDKNTPLEDGNEVFHTYVDGQKVSYQAPKDVVEAMKGMNRQEVDMVTGVIAKTNEIFKGGVTTFNIAFQIPNMIIDFQDAMVVAKNAINPVDWARGFASAVGKGKLYKQWREDGGAFSTYVSQATNARMTMKEVTAGTGRKAIRSIMNPLRLLEWAGSVAEETNRLAVYSRALRNGEDRMFAAYDSRQASVDFARYGNQMRVANQWVPFINARLQGTLNLARVSKERPARTMLRLAFLAAGPTVSTYLYNREFPEYYDIPQWEKDANYIIMTGTWQNDEGETMPSYIKIPKGHIGRMVSNPIENFMVFQDSGDGSEWDKLALQTGSNLMPFDVARDGELSLNATLNSVLPPAVKTPIEVQFANKSFFTERDIVPQSRQDASSQNQYRDDTSALAMDVGQTELAKTLGLSPAGFDYYVRGMLGQVGRDTINIIDTARGEGVWLNKEKMDEDDYWSKIPVISRFIGFRGGEGDTAAWDEIGNMKQRTADRRIEEEEVAKEIFETIRITPKEQRAEILKEYAQQGMITEGVDRRLEEMAKSQARDITAFDRALKSQSTDERAMYILSRVRETPQDERPLLIKTYKDKGILTDAVEEDIKRIVSEGQ